MDCGHIISLDAPEYDAQHIKTWVGEQGLFGIAKNDVANSKA